MPTHNWVISESQHYLYSTLEPQTALLLKLLLISILTKGRQSESADAEKKYCEMKKCHNPVLAH